MMVFERAVWWLLLASASAQAQQLRSEAAQQIDGKGCVVNEPIPHWTHFDDSKNVKSSYEEFFKGTQLHYRGHLSNPKWINDASMNFTTWSGDTQPNVVFWGSDMAHKGFVHMSAYNKHETLTGTDPNGIVMVDPKGRDFSNMKHDTVLSEPHTHYVYFSIVKFGVFAHFWLDYVGMIAYLRERFQIGQPDSNHKLILVDLRGQNQRLIQEVDPEFAKHVEWIDCFQPFECNHAVHVRGPTTQLTVFQPHTITRHMDLLEAARRWINERFPLQPVVSKKVIYYTRNSATANHGRAMNLEQESLLIASLKHTMERHGRPEELIIFDGEGYTLEQQVHLFRSATVVIGSHGGGMANLLFLNPKHETDGTCYALQNRPKVMEFMTNPATPKVQGGLYFKTYYNLYSTIPWAEYHHVLYVPPSGDVPSQGYFVDLQDYQEALNKMFSSDPTIAT